MMSQPISLQLTRYGFFSKTFGVALLCVAALFQPTARSQVPQATTIQDKNRVAAEQAIAEGEQLREQGKADSLKAAIKKYGEALMLARAVGDRRNEAKSLHLIGVVYLSLGDNRKVIEFQNQ